MRSAHGLHSARIEARTRMENAVAGATDAETRAVARQGTNESCPSMKREQLARLLDVRNDLRRPERMIVRPIRRNPVVRVRRSGHARCMLCVDDRRVALRWILEIIGAVDPRAHANRREPLA